jgi:SAM-dependent methyltransferase
MGLNGIAKGALRTLVPAFVSETARDFKYRKERYADYHQYANAAKDKMGLEVGGPTTWLFRYVLPVYEVAKGVDGVNFSTNTVWEGDIGEKGGRYNYYKQRHGNQFISEAADLRQIPDRTYDFLLSSNCLEHIANPLKAAREWKRVVKPGGALIVFVPNKAYNFDHLRDFTTFDHLLSDY